VSKAIQLGGQRIDATMMRGALNHLNLKAILEFPDPPVNPAPPSW